ncbi:ATP-binding protein [Ornithinimicrobium flavum]|uniref:ATP-binding protein n=1 Tax=Ornithinimicrobium flavum TaxID=1288636 RepID=UPI00106F8330|nr:AAA family ATPase [Ornithinimicrobium flavum]
MLALATSREMVGRRRELQALHEAVQRALDGVPHGALILGEAGIGKSRLVAELISGLPPEVRVARGQCISRGSLAPPLGPVREVVRDVLAHVGPDAVGRCAGPTVHVLSAVVPELGAHVDVEPTQEQVEDAVRLLLETVSAEVPLVVLLEDLHWADLPTLDLLRGFLQLLRRGRVLVVVTCRTDDLEPGDPVRSFLMEAGRNRGLTRLELGRLDTAEATRQVELLRPGELGPGVVEQLVRRADGVPFLLEELVALRDSGSEELPTTLRDLLLARYRRISPGAQEVVRLLAAGGPRLEHTLVAEVHEGGADALDGAVREAVAAQVLRTDGTAYSFRHALTHEAVHAELLPGELTRLHSRYAAALATAPPAPGRAAEVAHHHLLAQELPQALAALVAASREATAGGAPLNGGELGLRALELWDRVPDAPSRAGRTLAQVAHEVAVALDAAGDDRALAVIDGALARVGPEDPTGRAMLLHEAMVVRYSYGRSGGVELCREALTLVEDADDDLGRFVRARVRCGLGIALSFLLDPAGPDLLEAATEEVRQLLHEVADPDLRERARLEMVRAATNLATVRTNRRDVEETLAALREARALAGTDPTGLLRVDERVVLLLLDAGRFAEAREVAAAAEELARTNGMHRSWGAEMLLMQGLAGMALGDLDVAGETLTRARTLLTAGVDRAMVDAAQVELDLTRGDVAEAAQARYAASRHLVDEVRRGDPGDDLVLAYVGGWAALAQGDPASAWSEVTTLWRHRTPPLGLSYPLIALGAAALAAVRREGTRLPDLTPEEAEERLRGTFAEVALWAQAGDWGALIEAELSGEAGTGTDVAAWRAAVEATGLGRVPRYQHANSLLRLAEAGAGRCG